MMYSLFVFVDIEVVGIVIKLIYWLLGDYLKLFVVYVKNELFFVGSVVKVFIFFIFNFVYLFIVYSFIGFYFVGISVVVDVIKNWFFSGNYENWLIFMVICFFLCVLML